MLTLFSLLILHTEASWQECTTTFGGSVIFLLGGRPMAQTSISRANGHGAFPPLSRLVSRLSSWLWSCSSRSRPDGSLLRIDERRLSKSSPSTTVMVTRMPRLCNSNITKSLNSSTQTEMKPSGTIIQSWSKPLAPDTDFTWLSACLSSVNGMSYSSPWYSPTSSLSPPIFKEATSDLYTL